MPGQDDLKVRVAKWLDEQGYPLEMRVASVLQTKGFRAVQSEYFRDPESGDLRELDILAFIQQRVKNVLFRVSILVECKLSVDKPWLLFTSDRISLADSARVVQRGANQLGRCFLREIAQESTVQELPIFTLPQRPAYGLTQAFTQGRDVCYSAATSVSKAAFSSVEKLDATKQARRQSTNFLVRQDHIVSIVLPVIVVDGKLYDVYLGGSNEIVVEEITDGTLLWRNPLVGMPHTIISIVSSTAFDKFVDDARVSINRFIELAEFEYPDKIDRAIERENRILSSQPSLGSR